MFKNNLKVLFLVACLFHTGTAMAVTQSITAHIAFATPLSITQSSDIIFDAVKADMASTYAAKNQVRITIAGTADQVIDIAVNGVAADGGVKLQNTTCSYNGGDTGSCAINNAAAPGTGKSLLINTEAVADSVQTAGTIAAPAFTVSVVYQ